MIERYTLPEMGAIWNEEAKFRRWMNIEIAVCRAHARRGAIPKAALSQIVRKAGFSIARIEANERKLEHDVLAFLAALRERVGKPARYIHMGLTSYDVVDTGLSIAMRDAMKILLARLRRIASGLRKISIKQRNTVTVGRTHGVHAEPTSLGLKFALHYAETERNEKRMRAALETISHGKISGAVGNYAHLPPAIEGEVLRELGLKAAPISTQILQRDRHAEYLCALAILAGSLEKFALEVRNLQRTEILEIEEPFKSGQRGSSAMPHKRNPILSERICGLARLMRSYCLTGLENMALWHERDLTNSSAERVAIPDACILADYMLFLTERVLKGLTLYPDRMRVNLEKSGGVVYSQRVMIALVKAGMTRESAYKLVQGYAMAAWTKGGSFREMLAADRNVGRKLGVRGLEACFDPRYYLRNTSSIYRRLGLS